jgi:DNA-binding winged helix-turn-helix (wHTH) protein
VNRYRFSEFTLSPRRRLLVRQGREVPLIPRYFDLLLLLIERRHEAVHRREIFERVWADGLVSDSALSQAIRTIRRTLGDDSREPVFIRTVSRHGYRFVFPDVIEEADETLPVPAAVVDAERPGRRSRHPAGRWAARAAGGGALAGVAAGGVGGLILAAAPDSFAPIAIAPVLAVIGGGCGALGGAGVGAGLALARAARSTRTIALVLGAALGGGLVGAAVQWLTRWALAALVGRRHEHVHPVRITAREHDALRPRRFAALASSELPTPRALRGLALTWFVDRPRAAARRRAESIPGSLDSCCTHATVLSKRARCGKPRCSPCNPSPRVRRRHRPPSEPHTARGWERTSRD